MSGPQRQNMIEAEHEASVGLKDAGNLSNGCNSIDQLVERATLEQLFELLPQGLVATAVNSTLLVFVLSPVSTPPSLAIWLSLMFAITAARFALILSYRSKQSRDVDSKRWRGYFFTGAALTAALWGIAGSILFPSQSLEHQVLIGFVLAGMTAAASNSMAADDKVYRCYLLVALVPYVLSLAAEGTGRHVAMALMCVAFIITMVLASRKNSKTTRDALRLRFVNATLAADLEQTVSRLQSTNAAYQDVIGQHQQTLQSLELAASEAKASTNAKSQFLANMSHEIRTPMNGVFGMTDLLMRTKLDARQRKLLETINTSAKSLLTIINDILDLSRIEAGKLDIDYHEFNLRETIERAAELLTNEAHRKGLELSVFIAPDVPTTVISDSGRLKQVLINLIGNAVKFTKSGEVAVSVVRSGGSGSVSRVRFEIRDTGIGIDPAILDQLFQPFAQAETSINRRFGGTGLGLSISRHLIELMGGTIGIESTPGAGTRVTFEIAFDRPAAMPDSALPRAASFEGARFLVLDDGETNREASAPRRTIEARILLAEDNPVNIEVARELLQGIGMRVQIAQNGVEALAHYRAGTFDAVLMDFQMPVMDGITATRRIREVEQALSLPRTPIIAATANAFAEDKARCFEAGMDDYLCKPYSEKSLFDVLVRWLPQGVGRNSNCDPADGVADDRCAGAIPEEEPSPTPIDIQVLAPMQAARPDILARLIKTYLTHAPSIVREVLSANAGGDLETLGRLAHSLKSSSANLGAGPLAALCKELELAAKGSNLERAQELVPALASSFDAVCAALQPLVDMPVDMPAADKPLKAADG